MQRISGLPYQDLKRINVRRAAKIDANQNKVVEALRGIPGVTIAITSQLGGGFVDFILGYKGVNYMIELKDGDKPPSQRKLTEDEEKFHRQWKGQISVCSSFDDVFKVVFNGSKKAS